MKTTFYLAEIERFGYNLRVLEATENKARESLIAHYIKTYKDWNDGADPAEDIDRWGRSYLDSMKEDINITKMKLGELDWD